MRGLIKMSHLEGDDNKGDEEDNNEEDENDKFGYEGFEDNSK